MESTHRLAVKAILERFGAWSRINSGMVRGYPHEIPTRRLYSLPGQSIGANPLTDASAAIVNQALCKLRQVHPEDERVLHLYYVEGLDVPDVGRKINRKATVTREILKNAEKCVELLLDPDLLY